MNLPQIIALDMDGTLLDGNGQIPDGFWDVTGELARRGVHIAPASGRQLATLQDVFADAPVPPDTFIAENGSVVWHDGEILSTSPVRRESVRVVVDTLSDAPVGNNVVLATPRVAFVSADILPERLNNVRYYYHATELVDSYDRIIEEHDVVKVAIHAHTDAERDIRPLLVEALPGYAPAVSASDWVDVMEPGTNKGVALRQLANKLGIDISRTAAFGDFLNDYELLETAGTAVAMANGHPDLKAIADHIAPPNTEQGVVTVLRDWLDADDEAR